MTLRRTPKLTAEARRIFEVEFRAGRWSPYETISLIADETGLAAWQVRDAILSEQADEWRRALADKIMEERNAVHRR